MPEPVAPVPEPPGPEPEPDRSAEPPAPAPEPDRSAEPPAPEPPAPERRPSLPPDYTPSELSGHQLFRVELGAFAGPLDLLLFLIRKHDLDIFDIPIGFITERYLEMLDTLERLEIDVAGEFLVMAAELAHIKSKMLLPPKEGIPVEAEPKGEDGDPRADLVRRLLEYQKYRDAAGQLEDRDLLGADVFTRRPPPLDQNPDFDPGLRETSIFRLIESFADVMSRLSPRARHEITLDRVTVSDRILFVHARASAAGGSIDFATLVAEIDTRVVLVVTFLALLEMARTRVLRIEQAPEPVEPPPEPPPEPAGAEPPATRVREPLRPPRPAPIVLALTGAPLSEDLLRLADESYEKKLEARDEPAFELDDEPEPPPSRETLDALLAPPTSGGDVDVDAALTDEELAELLGDDDPDAAPPPDDAEEPEL